MKHKLILVFLVLLSLLSKGQVSVVVFVNDYKKEASDLRKMANSIYLESKIKVNSFKIIHFSPFLGNSDTWINKKKKVDYQSIARNCDDDFCSIVQNKIDDLKSGKNKIYTGASLRCDYLAGKYSIASLSSGSGNDEYQTIIDKILEEIELNRRQKFNLTLFFYIERGETFTNPTITFPRREIDLNKGDLYQLNPIYDINVHKVTWHPTEGISCIDCRTPILKPERNSKYYATVVDTIHCKTYTDSIEVKVKKCLCGDQYLKPVTDLFAEVNSNDSKYERRPGDFVDWIIRGNRGIANSFDILCHPNCANKYKVVVKNSKSGTELWSKEFEKSMLVQSVNYLNVYHDKYPNDLVFRLNFSEYESGGKLSLMARAIKDAENTFRIFIFSIDDDNKVCDNPYESPRVIFTCPE